MLATRCDVCVCLTHQHTMPSTSPRRNKKKSVGISASQKQRVRSPQPGTWRANLCDLLNPRTRSRGQQISSHAHSAARCNFFLDKIVRCCCPRAVSPMPGGTRPDKTKTSLSAVSSFIANTRLLSQHPLHTTVRLEPSTQTLLHLHSNLLF